MPAVHAIAKIDTARQYVFGWASIALSHDGTHIEDSQGHIIDPEDLEEAGYHFVLHYHATGEMHAGEAVGELIESFVVTPEKLTALGLAANALPQGIWVGFHIASPEVFAKVQSGEYAMFSIQGTGVLEEVTHGA